MLADGDTRTSDTRITQHSRYPQAQSLEWRALSTRDKRFLKRAASFARKREVDYQNHCAIVTRGPKVVAIGFNSYKNDPASLSEEHMRMVKGRNSVMGVGCHAEVAALNQLTDPAGVTVYVARVLKDGTIANSAPCEGCQQALYNAGVRRVVWTEDNLVLD